MKDIDDKLLASTQLTIDLAKNICKLIPYEIDKNKVMIPSKNEVGANIVAKGKTEVKEEDSLFYLDYVGGRIVHVTSSLVFEIGETKEDKIIKLQVTNQGVGLRDKQKWDVPCIKDGSHVNFKLRFNTSLALALDNNGNLILSNYEDDVKNQKWYLEWVWNLKQ